MVQRFILSKLYEVSSMELFVEEDSFVLFLLFVGSVWEGNLMRFWGENAESAEEERVYEYKLNIKLNINLTPELLYENSAL